ncbi:MAG: NnrS family protein [Pseudorhodoplanes sp.]|nr:NnrS family protein [Pseudorhodoplanes sp.]MCL4710391.1 NnrS family protein [Pseudorhodoplanes sp.]
MMSIPAALARRREYCGPALFSYGFRPFFLGGAAWAALSILLWIPQYVGALTVPTALAATDWHGHEMIYGYGSAVIAGFLLTAIPNWTGRLPVCGLPLAGLAALWLAGRIAIFCSTRVGLGVAATIDTAFLVLLALVAMREIVAGRNWRNLRVLGVLGVLIAGNIVFHVEVIRTGASTYGLHLGIAAIVLLITLIGGRIIPSFTRNWLVRQNPGRLPQPFSRYDGLCVVASALALALWVFAPAFAATPFVLLATGLLQAYRLVRWAGDRTFADRLVLVLHVGYAFVPLGFLLTALSGLWPDHVPPNAGLHAWSAGAIGMMTLAVMTRASLGHTGRALAATPATQAIYAFAFAAAVLRIVSACTGDMTSLYLAATLWVAAFGGFAAVYGPWLVRRPPAWSAAH